MAAALVGLATIFGVATPAAADDLDERMVARYEVRPEAASVAVSLTMTVTNNTANQYLANGIRYFYLDRFSTPIHRGAVGVRASSGGRALNVEVLPIVESRFFDRLEIALAAPLYSGETQELVVSYELPGGAPRSDSAVRVNPAYASFAAFGAGDEGQVAIELTVPADFDLEAAGFRSVGSGNGTVTYSTGPVGVEGMIDVRLVGARADSRLAATRFDAGGEEVLVRSWPGDDAWVTFAQDIIGRSLPELERLVGLPWPVAGPLEVLQTDSASLNGYDGRYDSSTDVIEVDEDLDAHVMVHELAHAWFNRDLFQGIWINEGLAETYAERTLATLGIEDRERATEPDRSSPYAVPLDRWRRPDLDDPDGGEKELWSYGAAHWVMEQLVAEIGTDAMADVLARVDDDTMAYLGEDPSQQSNRDPDWRRLLDLVEEVGGSTSATELFEQWVIAPGDTGDLDDRTEARAAYRSLVADSNGWTTPLVLRRALDDWQFDEVAPLVAGAREVLARRAELETVLQPLGLPMPTVVEETYEQAHTDFDHATDIAEGQLADARRVAAAVARADASQGTWTRLGLWRSDLPTRRAAVLEAYRTQETGGVERSTVALDQLLDGADRRGKLRAGIAAGGVVGLGLIGALAALLLFRRRPDAPGAVAATGNGAVGPYVGVSGPAFPPLIERPGFGPPPGPPPGPPRPPGPPGPPPAPVPAWGGVRATDVSESERDPIDAGGT